MKKKITRDILEDLYTNQRKTIYDLGEMFSVGTTTILYYLKKFNIPTRNRGLPKIEIKKEVLKDLYIDQKKSQSEVASMLGVSVCIVQKKIKEYNLISKEEMKDRKRQALQKIVIEDKELVDLLKNRSQSNVAKMLGVSRSTVCKYLKRHNISI
ncbi:MAG: hypothetical protein N2645_02505 [Clostridia bacterium]|nr:hypothetical protein [Clostridia bacterium]